VGDGKGLNVQGEDGNSRAVLIVSLAAVLALAILILLGLAVRPAVDAWLASPARHVSANRPSQPERRYIPRPNPALANASIKGNPGQFFGPDAYPPEAIRAEQQGRTVADLLIDATGTPIGCTIATSSGSRSLDAATCSIALGRVRFDPARDARGAAKQSHYRMPVRWVLPEG
jgi:TonB family protein